MGCARNGRGHPRNLVGGVKPLLITGTRRCLGIQWLLPISQCPCFPVFFAISDFGLQLLLFPHCGSLGAEEKWVGPGWDVAQWVNACLVSAKLWAHLQHHKT